MIFDNKSFSNGFAYSNTVISPLCHLCTNSKFSAPNPVWVVRKLNIFNSCNPVFDRDIDVTGEQQPLPGSFLHNVAFKLFLTPIIVDPRGKSPSKTTINILIGWERLAGAIRLPDLVFTTTIWRWSLSMLVILLPVKIGRESFLLKLSLRLDGSSAWKYNEGDLVKDWKLWYCLSPRWNTSVQRKRGEVNWDSKIYLILKQIIKQI